MRDHGTLRTGPRSLSRLFCAKCKDEVIHVKGQCVHCGTCVPQTVDRKLFNWNRDRVKT